MNRNIVLGAVAIVALAGCEGVGPTRAVDAGSGANVPLEKMPAGIWVDPDGCDHWIIDDGYEGFASPRVDRQGRPVCRPDALPGTSNVRRTVWG
jgi:hypothetical protein